MVFDPARGAIEIHWNHTDEPQQTGGLVTNRGPFGSPRAYLGHPPDTKASCDGQETDSDAKRDDARQFGPKG
jgi:hypothetical protein